MLQGGAVMENTINDVLAAIQLLINTLAEEGIGNQFMIAERPEETLAARQELIDLVNYLNALYG